MGYLKLYTAGNVSIATNTNLLLPFGLTELSAAPWAKVDVFVGETRVRTGIRPGDPSTVIVGAQVKFS